jgi:signal transduction histidine kinase
MVPPGHMERYNLKTIVNLQEKMKLKPEILVPRLGEYLVEKRIITEAELKGALEKQQTAMQTTGARLFLGQSLVDMGVIDKDALDTVVTEQILALRKALEDTNRDLEQTVMERTAELAQALDKLAEINKMQIRFVSNISHELRTPLFHISGNLELVLDEDMGSINTDQQKALTVAQRATERLGNLIEDLILFTSTKDSPLKLRMQATPVFPICEDAVAQLQEATKKAGVSLHFDYPIGDVTIMTNPDRLSWVIRHLIENAVKFTGKNGSVALRIREQGEFIVFAVEDTGIGIPCECFEEIFEPFHQLDEDISRRYGGMGLGLTLARKIIAAHGTDISVSSEVGKGSSFSFSIPKAPS